MLSIEQLVKERRLKIELMLNKECTEWATEVIKLIGNKKILIPFYNNFEKTLKPASKLISIAKILPLVLKEIVFADIDSLAIYKRKERTPFDLTWSFLNEFSETECPFSFNFYAGVIAINEVSMQSKGSFCYTIAHQLLHAIDLLPHVYPAFYNWYDFYEMVSLCKNKGIEDPCDDFVDNIDYLTSHKKHKLMKDLFGDVVNEWNVEEYLFFRDKKELLRVPEIRVKDLRYFFETLLDSKNLQQCPVKKLRKSAEIVL